MENIDEGVRKLEQEHTNTKSKSELIVSSGNAVAQQQMFMPKQQQKMTRPEKQQKATEHEVSQEFSTAEPIQPQFIIKEKTTAKTKKGNGVQHTKKVNSTQKI